MNAHRVIQTSADGIDVVDARSRDVCRTLPWPRVEEIIALKIDALTFDRLCIGFREADSGTYLFVDEDMPGGWS